MGLSGLIKATFLPTTAFHDIVARYQRLRRYACVLNNLLASRLSRDVLYDGAKRIGIFHGGTIVFDNEDQSCRADGLLHLQCPSPRPQRRRTVPLRLPARSRFRRDGLFARMQHATYGLLAVLRLEPGVGCHVRNLFTEETRLLVNMGLSKTAKAGLVMATRLLDSGDYIATGGAALPWASWPPTNWKDGSRSFMPACRTTISTRPR